MATASFEEAAEAATAGIRDYLSRMPPYEFQNLVAALLKAMGYHVLWVAPPGPDRGINLIAYNDPLGTSSPRIKVQVKRQAESKIGRDGVSSFPGTLGAHDVGIYVSAGGFTTEAEREARSQEQKRLTLIDLGRLVELWIEHSPQLDDAERQLPPSGRFTSSPPASNHARRDDAESATATRGGGRLDSFSVSVGRTSDVLRMALRALRVGARIWLYD